MKKLIFILLFIPQIVLGNNYYVATTGNNSNAGTIGSPWLTWQYAFNQLSAGDTLFIRGGTYYATGYSSGGNYYGVKVNYLYGTSSEKIVVKNYLSEVPILDGTNVTQNGMHFGINMDDCSYWHLKGLTVKNFKEYVSGGVYKYANGWNGSCTNMIFEQCRVEGCGMGFTFGGIANNLYFLNCDSYNNVDFINDGDYSDGFNVNIGVGTTVIYEGCRSWYNSDDGFDSYNTSNYSGTLSYINCWSWDNGRYVGGDGVAFKLGDVVGPPPDLNIRRTVRNCVAWDNKAGIDEGQENADGDCISMNIYNNTLYNNFYRNLTFSAHEPTTGLIRIFNNISYNDGIYGDVIRVDAQLTQTTNSWQIATVTDADFVSVSDVGADGARKSNGDLPDIDFLKLDISSDMIDIGTYVGVDYAGDAPDLGAFEYGSAKDEPTIPTVTTALITAITATTATSGGNVTDDGGVLVNARGICWSTAPNPTILNHNDPKGTGEGEFTSYLTGLENELTYYVRAYATNSVGTAYGNNEVFTASSTPPVIGLTHFVTNGSGGIHYKVKSNGKFVKSK